MDVGIYMGIVMLVVKIWLDESPYIYNIKINYKHAVWPSTNLWSEFDVQMDFRLQLFVNSRVVRQTRYRRVVVFHFRYESQNGFGCKPFALGRHGLDGHLSAILDHFAIAVGPCDLNRKKKKFNY